MMPKIASITASKIVPYTIGKRYSITKFRLDLLRLQRWVTILCQQLLFGPIDSVIKAIRKISADKNGKNSKKIQKNQEL